MAFERTRANLKKYTKYSINLTFRLQKSTYMWYNVIKYSIYKVKKGANYDSYSMYRKQQRLIV